jgi:sugar-specific transcriptional regulator TrmB
LSLKEKGYRKCLERKEVCSDLTQEWLLKTLIELGFKEHDARVYIFIALTGPRKAKDIVVGLATYKRKVYRSLKRLENNGMVIVSSRVPAEFSAIPFDQVLDLLRMETLKESDQMEKKKDYYLELWKTNVTKEPKN